MTPIVAVTIVAIGVLAWLLVTPWWRARRRAARMAEPLPEIARAAIDRNVPSVRRLPPELRARLESLMGAFLAEKEFIGCNGLVVTDEIRSTIAALACLLVLGRRGHYDELHSILVYPAAFWVEDEVEDEAGVVAKRRRVLSGEAWESSRIILSWDDVLEAARFPGEGYNVALHEFAHYLDAEGLGLGLAASRQQSTPRGGVPAHGRTTSPASSSDSSTPSIAASSRSSIRTRPRTRRSSSRSRPRTSSSVRSSCMRRIRGCTGCCGSSMGSIPLGGLLAISTFRVEGPERRPFRRAARVRPCSLARRVLRRDARRNGPLRTLNAN